MTFHHGKSFTLFRLQRHSAASRPHRAGIRTRIAIQSVSAVETRHAERNPSKIVVELVREISIEMLSAFSSKEESGNTC